MIDNYIFYFGQVIVEFDPYKIMEPYIPQIADRDAVAGILFARKYWERLDDGTLTETDIIKEILPQIPERLKENAALVLENWYKRLPVKTGTMEIIKYLKSRGKRIYLLSNISKTFAENWMNIDYLNDIFSYFDGLVFSGEIGLVKPNKEIFSYTLNKFDILPESTLFIDDNEQNIKGAEVLKINTFLFSDNYAQLKNYIDDNMLSEK